MQSEVHVEAITLVNQGNNLTGISLEMSSGAFWMWIAKV